MFIKNSFQGVVPAMSLQDNHKKLIVATTEYFRGSKEGTKRIRAVNDGQKGTKRTRAVNDGDTATIQPKGRVDVNVTDKVAIEHRRDSDVITAENPKRDAFLQFFSYHKMCCPTPACFNHLFILKQDISILSTSTQHGLCHLKLMNIALVELLNQARSGIDIPALQGCSGVIAGTACCR
eukprot:Em0101g8a